MCMRDLLPTLGELLAAGSWSWESASYGTIVEAASVDGHPGSQAACWSDWDQ